MNAAQLGIVVVGGLAGWWVVSYFFDRKKNDAHSAAHGDGPATRDGAGAPASPGAPGSTGGSGASAAILAAAGSSATGGLSVFELGDRWPDLLGVSRTASLAEIEAAYTARRVELGRRRYDSTLSSAERDAIVQALRDLDAAYEFVSAARAGQG